MIGIISLLLIGFWSTRTQAKKAALKAMFFNKIGDCALLLAFALLFSFTKTLHFESLSSIVPFFQNVILFPALNISLLEVISFSLFVGVMAKSAQLFVFPVWLLSSMEGPTPVSALLHAATLVTAGVFLLIRCSFIFESAPRFSLFIAFIGILTAIYSGTSAFFQNDLKKIIAYSTASQVGYMVTACGFSAYKIAFFHLFTHGFVKALIFLSAGLLIHNFFDQQDVRKMGGCLNFFPLTSAFFLISSSSLLGLPGLACFFSKESILDHILFPVNSLNPFFSSAFNDSLVNGSAAFFIYHLALLALLFTSLYSFRLFYYLFLVSPQGPRSYYTQK